jgi:polyisoprenoid-binding protein YceI
MRITFTGSALTVSHQGTFTRFTGQFDCPDSDPAHAHLAAEIDMDSVTTEIALLTKHLKQSDFFDVARYPKSSFISSHIERSEPPDNTFIITGNFTIHGITKTISFPATFIVDGNSISLSATLTIRQSDFAMQSARITSDDVPVTVTARFRRRSQE